MRNRKKDKLKTKTRPYLIANQYDITSGSKSATRLKRIIILKAYISYRNFGFCYSEHLKYLG